MAARGISFGWTLPAYAVQSDVWKGEAITLTFTRATATTISGWTITFTLKQFHDDASAALSISGTITDASNGVFTVALTAAQTALAVGRYVFDVWRTDSGSETQMATGYLDILERIR